MWASSKKTLMCHYEKSIKNCPLSISCSLLESIVRWRNKSNVTALRKTANGCCRFRFRLINLWSTAEYCVCNKYEALSPSWKKENTIKEVAAAAVVVVVDYCAQSICRQATGICTYLFHNFFHNYIIRKSICAMMIHWTIRTGIWRDFTSSIIYK